MASLETAIETCIWHTKKVGPKTHLVTVTSDQKRTWNESWKVRAISVLLGSPIPPKFGLARLLSSLPLEMFCTVSACPFAPITVPLGRMQRVQVKNVGSVL